MFDAADVDKSSWQCCLESIIPRSALLVVVIARMKPRFEQLSISKLFKLEWDGQTNLGAFKGLSPFRCRRLAVHQLSACRLRILTWERVQLNDARSIWFDTQPRPLPNKTEV
jgi:hypothetical protein